MGLEPSYPNDPILPSVPPELRAKDPALYDFLHKLKIRVEGLNEGLFNTDRLIIEAMNSGTSGTFTISSGGSIIVTSGVVVTVTS